MNVIVSILVLVLVAQVLATQSDDEAWIEYKIKFAKSHNRDDDSFRKQLFLKTHRLIKEHNSSGKSWTLAHNHFSDWTDEERQRMFNKKLADADKKRQQNFNNSLRASTYTETPFVVSSFNPSDYPAELDYRTIDDPCAINYPARDQGACGSCYVFAAITPLEYVTCKKLGKMIELSEQQVIDCSVDDGACEGGADLHVWAQLYHIGAVPSSVYTPYKAKNEYCDMCNVIQPNVVIRPTGMTWAQEENGVTTAQAIIVALNKFGPLAMAIHVPENFQELMQYGDGVFDDPNCTTARDHAIVLVGYGTTDQGTDYWIFRNSWSTVWGKNGYGIIRRGVNRCGFEESARAVLID